MNKTSDIGTAQRHTPVTFETTLGIRVPSDPQISADGTQVAFVLSERVADRPTPRERIWLVETQQGAEPHPFTDGPKGDTCPRWSPDGRWLAFVSERDEADWGHPQLYLMPAMGGSPHRLCLMPNGVSGPAWSPDGDRLAFLSLEGEEPSTEPKVDEGLRHQRLWTIRPESDTPEPVTAPDLTVWSYAWSPDGAQLAVYYSTSPGETAWYRGQIGVVPATGGAVRQVTQLTRQAAALAWARDGQQLYYVSGEWSDRPLIGGDIYVLPLNDEEPRNLTPSAELSVSWVHELPDGRLLYAAWEGLTNAVGLLHLTTGERVPLARDYYLGDGSWPRLSATSDGRRCTATHADETHPLEVWLGEIGGTESEAQLAWRRLTRLNAPAEETLAIVPSQRISYTGADNWRIEGLFTPPMGGRTGAPPPLVVWVHGGPTSAFRETYLQPGRLDAVLLTQLLANAGFATLRVNPRGGMGRGVAFADAVLGDPGGKDLEDVLRGVDYIVEQGWADGERVAIGGWSYGGFLTAWAVTQTPRFKAAVVGAGICDFHSFHAQSNIPDWDMRVLAADPLVEPEAYRARSAITFAQRVTTPTLVLHGEQDPSVPVSQAYACYRALRECGVPAELAVYPREGHGVRECEHLRDIWARLIRWFERYV
jgi:dipeptidyl aminopeptidase/acylaminoacyl peptidase